MWERTIVVNGFSKAYAMTGWRLGYAAGPKPVLQQMLKVHQFAIMCAPTTSQYAAVSALKNGDEDCLLYTSLTPEEFCLANHVKIMGEEALAQGKSTGIICTDETRNQYNHGLIRSMGLRSKAVSYTHLDVYKRQGFGGKAH